MSSDPRSASGRPTAPVAPDDPRTTSEIVQDVVSQTQQLFRLEVELAKAELQQAVTDRLAAVAGLVVAGVLALYALGFLAAAAAAALSEVVAAWLAKLIVAFGFLLLAGVGVAIARNRATTPVAPRTQDTMKENARWARTQLRR